MRVTLVLFWCCLSLLSQCKDGDGAAGGGSDSGLDAGGDPTIDAGDSEGGTDWDAGGDAQPDGDGGGVDTDTTTDPASGFCEPEAELTPGVLVSETTCDDDNDLEEYSCTPIAENGPDAAYRYELVGSEPMRATAVLSGLTADLDLFLLKDTCAAEACAAYSIGPAREEASLVLTPGQTLFAVVDGYKGTCGSFNLELTLEPAEVACADGADNDGDGHTDCADFDCGWTEPCVQPCWAHDTIVCDQTITASSVGATNLLEFYRDYPVQMAAGERIHAFFAAGAGMAVDLTLGPTAEDLSMFVLEGQCFSDRLIATHDRQLHIEPSASTTYFVAVDGPADAESPFDLSLRCRELVCDDQHDNDDDGLVDCLDTDCAFSPHCVVLCNPLADTFCPDAGDTAGQACYLLSSNPFLGFCHDPGIVELNAPCEHPYDCLPGLVCTPAGVCLNGCDLTDPVGEVCSLDLSCVSIGADPLGVCI